VPRYRLTRAADDDVAAIFLAGIDMFGLAQADSYHAGMAATFAFLADYPQAARLRHEIDPLVRVWPYKAHLVVYEVDEHGILVLRVRHGREDWMGDGQE